MDFTKKYTTFSQSVPLSEHDMHHKVHSRRWSSTGVVEISVGSCIHTKALWFTPFGTRERMVLWDPIEETDLLDAQTCMFNKRPYLVVLFGQNRIPESNTIDCCVYAYPLDLTTQEAIISASKQIIQTTTMPYETSYSIHLHMIESPECEFFIYGRESVCRYSMSLGIGDYYSPLIWKSDISAFQMRSNNDGSTFAVIQPSKLPSRYTAIVYNTKYSKPFELCTDLIELFFIHSLGKHIICAVHTNYIVLYNICLTPNLHAEKRQTLHIPSCHASPKRSILLSRDVDGDCLILVRKSSMTCIKWDKYNKPEMATLNVRKAWMSAKEESTQHTRAQRASTHSVRKKPTERPTESDSPKSSHGKDGMDTSMKRFRDATLDLLIMQEGVMSGTVSAPVLPTEAWLQLISLT